MGLFKTWQPWISNHLESDGAFETDLSLLIVSEIDERNFLRRVLAKSERVERIILAKEIAVSGQRAHLWPL